MADPKDISAWRIDALNARGGVAFTSYRTADLREDAQANLDVPCYALSAPDFRPEPLTSRALAFAGERRGLQLGVWDDGTELAFDDLETVVEFVRRVYLTASGRGGGGGGGEAPPVPVEVGGGPDRPVSPRGEAAEKIAAEFLEVARQFGMAGPFGDAVEMKSVYWPKVQGDLDTRRGLRDLGASAAYATFNEALDRAVPRSHQSYPQWHRSFVAALHLGVEFGLYRHVRQHDKYYIQRLEKTFPMYPPYSVFDYALSRWTGGLVARGGDALAVLELLPVDKQLAKALGHREPEQASVFDIVRILAANPKELTAKGDEEATRTRLSVLILAAIVLTHSTAYGLPFEFEGDILDAEAVLSWLVAQLPPGHFDEKIERMIGTVGLI